MKKVLLLTDVYFWREGAGDRARIARLVEYLSGSTLLTVLYLGQVPISDNIVLQTFNVRWLYFNQSNRQTPGNNGRLIKKLLNGEQFDVVIIEYIHNAFYLKYIDNNVLKILDAHDIISARSASFKQFNYSGQSYELEEDAELNILRHFHFILLLSEQDCRFLNEKLSTRQAICVPHIPQIKEQALRREAKTVGFVGSQYLPNKDAIEFFIDNCWELVTKKHGAWLNIYGSVSYLLESYNNHKNIRLKGPVPTLNDIYKDVDIFINPVRFGAGVKIKNTEALANGVPLVTTTHGANGLEEGARDCFLIADTPSEFIEQVCYLIENYEARKNLSARALDYARHQFNPSKCYGILAELINKG